MSENQTILYSKPRPHVAHLVLNRPETRNAQDTAFLYALNDAFDRAAQDDAVEDAAQAGPRRVLDRHAEGEARAGRREATLVARVGEAALEARVRDERARLERELAAIRPLLQTNGFIWVSWPKQAAKVETDVTEDVIREVALPTGLVDIKVCAVDEIWSGLKLVVRKENR